MNSGQKTIIVLSGVMCLFFVVPLIGQQTMSLQQLTQAMHSNYELLKAQGSLVQSKQAASKAIALNRLPHLNTMFQATVASNNNIEGDYMAYGVIPSIVAGSRAESKLTPVSGDAAFAGLNWEAVNFGEHKAQENLAKSDLMLQNNKLASTQYDLDGLASAYYVELIRQYEQQNIQHNNVTRLQQLKSVITALVLAGTRPGVDSAVAASELSKAMVGFYEAQKNFAQTQVALSTLTTLPATQFAPDTTAESKVMNDGMAFAFAIPLDTLHHPYISLYTSLYDYSQSRLKLEKSSYYPKIFVDADAWMRGSSLSNSDHFNNNLGEGYVPSRFNYLAGLTLVYDIFNIAHKHFNTSVYKYQAEAAQHQLENEKQKLQGAVQQASIEKDYQFNRTVETKHQLDAASTAYQQQLSLYNNGLSSIIELNTTLDYFMRAEQDYSNAKAGLMRSILNYALVTNSFNTLVQTLKL